MKGKIPTLKHSRAKKWLVAVSLLAVVFLALYFALRFPQALQDVNVQISTANVGQAWQNGYAKRLIRTVKEEEVDLHPSMYTVYHKSGPQERSLSDRLLGP